MEHRKMHHIKNVAPCRDGRQCTIGQEKCWYKHSENIENEIIFEENAQSNEIIERVFGMLEEYAERIKLLENQNY